MTSPPLARVRLPDAEALAVGLGLLAAAGLLVAPLVIGPPTFAGDTRILGVPPGTWLAAGAGIVAIAGVADLLGRTELRQGVAVLGAAGLFAAGALLFFSVRAVLGAGDPEGVEALVPYAVHAVWACALVVGTVAWGPTRTAVLIGLVTIAISLLLPIGPDGEPFLGYALDSLSSYILIPAGAAVLVGVWRLLDLPRIGGIVLGGALAVFTQVWLQGAPAAGVPCPGASTACLQPTDIQGVVWAGCLFVAFGTLFGMPEREA